MAKARKSASNCSLVSLTQEKLAELVDLKIRTVQKIEAGEINILITTASRLQRAIGCGWEKLSACTEALSISLRRWRAVANWSACAERE